MKSCVILGGAGFIGSHVARRLSKDMRVRAFGRHNPTVALPQNVEWFLGDFTDETAVAAAIEGHETVIHLIHPTFPSTANAEIIPDVQRSIIPTIRLLDSCVALGVKRVVFFSSGGTVYGPTSNLPISEDAPVHPISAYGISKLTIEHYLRFYEYTHGLRYFVVRLGNPFGPNQMGLKNQGLVSVVGRRILSGDAIVVYGDGSVRRDYIYVDDVADFTFELLQYQGSHRVFNVGGGEGRSILEVIRVIEDAAGRKADLYFQAARRFDVPCNVLCTERAERELGWAPKIEFSEGIKRTVHWLMGK